MAELGEYYNIISCENNQTVKNIKVETDMLDYDYVKTCSSLPELKAILKTLASGNEGRYPHLEKIVEQKIISLLPPKEQRRILAVSAHISMDEMLHEKQILDEWSKDLEDSKLHTTPHCEQSQPTENKRQHIPAVRGSHIDSSLLDYERNIDKENHPPQGNHSTDKVYNRICKETLTNKQYFEAWDKFSVEDAERVMEEDELRLVKKANSTKELLDMRVEKERSRRAKQLETFSEKYNLKNLNLIERKFMAEKEKAKGNDCFRNKEYADAIVYYSKSIALDDTNPVLYTNRALSSMRLSNFNQAIADCNEALKIDCKYAKALARRGMIHQKCGRHLEALKDLEECIKLEPENDEYSKLIKKIKKDCGEDMKTCGQNDRNQDLVKGSMCEKDNDGVTITHDSETEVYQSSIDSIDVISENSEPNSVRISIEECDIETETVDLHDKNDTCDKNVDRRNIRTEGDSHFRMCEKPILIPEKKQIMDHSKNSSRSKVDHFLSDASKRNEKHKDEHNIMHQEPLMHVKKEEIATSNKKILNKFEIPISTFQFELMIKEISSRNTCEVCNFLMYLMKCHSFKKVLCLNSVNALYILLFIDHFLIQL